MKTYIVIPQYLISDELVALSKNAIRSFKNTADCTVISVDDCGDREANMLMEESDVYVSNNENSGFAKTCNAGFRWIQENEKEDCYIVCANNDIEVYPGWLETFDDLMKRFDGAMVGGLGYRGRDVDGMHIKKYKENTGSAYQWNFITIGGQLNDWLFPGGFYMTKKSILDDVGLYDENFVHGGYEDIDLFYRVKLAGGKLIMTPKVAYWHKEGATRFSDAKGEKGRQAKAEPKNVAYFKEKWGMNPNEKMGLMLRPDKQIET